MPGVSGVDYSKTRHTVILALNPQCRYCRDELPFYRSIAAGRYRVEGRVQLVVLSNAPTVDIERFLAESEVRVDRLADLSAGTYKITGTPTLLVVNSAARVEGAWTGRLKESERKEVTAILSR